MKAALWYQREFVDDKDSFIIDGIKQIADNTIEQNEAFSQITTAREWPSSKLLSVLIKKYPQASKKLLVFFKEHKVMIQSHFVDKDDVGRLIPYMFLSNNETEALAQLKDYAKLAGRTINDSDLKVIEELLRFRKNKTTYTISIIIILILLILVIK